VANSGSAVVPGSGEVSRVTSRTWSNDRTVIAGAVRVRTLIATDYAREGLNLQNHCCNLFHFDVRWNPARFEQRNGHIDRTLQPSRHVWCHYFAYADRREDAVIDTLVKKVETIQRELGTLSDVVMQRMDRALGFQTDTGALRPARASAEVGAHAGQPPPDASQDEPEWDAARAAPGLARASEDHRDEWGNHRNQGSSRGEISRRFAEGVRSLQRQSR